MNLKNSFSVLSSNLSLIYKVLFFFFILLLLAVAITVSIVNPVIKEVNEELDIQGIRISIDTLLNNPIGTVQKLWNTTVSYFASNLGQLILRVFYVCLMVITIRFLTSFVLFPTSVMLYERMTANNRITMSSALISNFLKALLYSLVSALIIGLIDFSIMLLSAWLMAVAYKALRVFSIFFGIIVGLILFSIRIVLASNWLPVLIAEERNVFRALKKGIILSSQRFLSSLAVIFTLNALMLSLVLSLSIPTFGLVPLLTVPFWAILLCALSMTKYFKARGKKYYTDNEGTVYAPPEQDSIN